MGKTSAWSKDWDVVEGNVNIKKSESNGNVALTVSIDGDDKLAAIKDQRKDDDGTADCVFDFLSARQ